MDLVITFDRGERLGEERDRVPFSIVGRDLREDGAGSEVRTVGLYAEWFRRVGRDEDRGGGDVLLQFVEGRLFVSPPVPSGVISGEVKERPSVLREVLYEPAIEINES